VTVADQLAVLTDIEKNKVRRHLGYPTVNPVPSITIGLPAKIQTAFLVDFALENIRESAIGEVRRLVSILERIELQILEAPERQAARSIGEVTTNPDELRALDDHYLRWVYELAGVLGCPVNANHPKFSGGGGGRVPLHLPVRRA
jgi:hypothetical protein